MKKKILLILAILIVIAGCSNKETSPPNSQSSQAGAKTTLDATKTTDATAETPKETEEVVQTSEAPEEKRQLFSDVIFSKRNIPLFESDKGSLVFLGELIDSETGSFSAAIRYTGELVHADHAQMYFNFIFEDGTALYMTPSDVNRKQFDKDGQINVLFKNEAVTPTNKLVRIDYSFTHGESAGTVNEADKKTITLSPTEETVKLPPVYALENTNYALNELRKDKDKEVYLTDVSINETEGTINLMGEITYKKDEKKQVLASAYFPSTQDMAIAQTDYLQYYANVTTPFSFVFDNQKFVGSDEGAVVHFEVDNMRFAFDFRTGKFIQEPLTLTSLMTDNSNGSIDTVPITGIKTNNGEAAYNVISFRYPENGESGANGNSTHPFVIGGDYKTFTFTLASGELNADKGGEYDVYLFGDDLETARDTNEISGNELFHVKMKGTDTPKKYTVDVTGVRTLYLYYNTNYPRKSSDDNPKEIQLMVIDPLLK